MLPLRVMRPMLAATLVLSALLAGGCRGEPDRAAREADAVRDLANEVAWASRYEVAAAELMLRRRPTAEVEEFAQAVVDDYRRANALLENTARESGLPLPGVLDDERRLRIEALRTTPRADVETAYLEQQRISHREVEVLLERAREQEHAGLRRLAEDVLPDVRRHLARAEALAERRAARGAEPPAPASRRRLRKRPRERPGPFAFYNAQPGARTSPVAVGASAARSWPAACNDRDHPSTGGAT